MDAFLATLNSAQRAAVTSEANVLQVLAPPGSGKTKTLTARVSYLITACGYRPWNIIVCTFTVKAAKEMRERITSLVGESLAKQLVLGTFHSVARRFLVSYGHYIGLDKTFGIADTSDTKAIIKRIVKNHQLSIEPDRLGARISSQKAKGIDSEAYALTAPKGVDEQEFTIAFREYEAALKLANLLDYDDLLLRCALLLRANPQCVANVQAVLIDEFQDTNEVQFDLMNLFAQSKHIITVVGDPDQSIYGWRNAEIKNLETMKAQYPDTLVHFLEENYRSCGAILDAAQAVIDQDESRPPKRLRATHGHGSMPVLRRLPTAASEARWLVDEIARSIALSGDMLRPADFAILLRSASVSRHIETALSNAGLPYRMVGGTKFYDRAEVKIMLDYLRIVNQPQHDDAILRVLNIPPRGIGEVSVKNLQDEAHRRKTPLWEVLLATAQGRIKLANKLSAPIEKGLTELVSVILGCRKKIEQGAAHSSVTPSDILDHLIKKTKFEAYLQKKYPDDIEARWANVAELRAQTADLSNAMASGDDPCAQENLPLIDGAQQRTVSQAEDALTIFLSNIALSNDVQKRTAEQADESQCVTISTIHAAKGLEWPVVFIPACYTGCIPHSRAEDHDEERRLLYVGMTRAQAMLYLSCPLKNSQTQETTISSFLHNSSVTIHFADQGPALEYYAISLLAKTLQRGCPLFDKIQECRQRLDRLLDDKWPIDGSELPEEEEPWRSRGPRFGRDRLEIPNAGPSSGGAGFVSAASIAMQHNDGYSVRKASAHIARTTTASESEQVGGDSTHQLAANTTDKIASKKVSKIDRRAASIASYFGHPKAGAVAKQDLPCPREASPEMSQTPLIEMTKSAVNGRAPAKAYNCFSVTATHKPRTLSSKSRHTTTNQAEGDDYKFLSSSPPREDRAACKRQKVDQPQAQPHAASFHVTTMTQVAQARNPSAKTLGLGRAFVPWNARRNK